jgi:hypothetical protein
VNEPTSTVARWDEHTPERCPTCYAITDPDRRAAHSVVVCCRCGQEFTRFPRLARFLPHPGEVCPTRNDPTH